MKLFRWFILRPLRREPLRSGLTVAGIALGIAVVLAIRLANESSVRGFAMALDAVSGRTSLEIVGPGIGVGEGLLSELGWLRGFGRLSPVIDGDALVRGLGGENAGPEQVRVLGVDILRDEAFRDYSLADTGSSPVVTTQEFLALLTDPQAIVLTSTFATRHGLSVGDEVELVAGGGAVRLVVRGTLGDDGPASARDGNIALMDIAAAQMALGRLGVVDRVDVQLEDPLAIEASELAIADRLPPGLSVQRPERRGAQVEKMLAAFHFNLSALSYIALLVGLFLVYNTVSVSVITRRDEIGMLRTVGARRRTVLALFLGEAVCLACLGCALGAPLGWGLAYLTVGLTSSTVSQFWVASAATVPPLEAADIALGFAVGLPLAVVAALMPALEAARMTPVAVVRDERNLLVRERLPRRYLAGTALLFGIGGWCATRAPVDDLPLFGLAAALCVVLGAALLTPVVLHGVQRLGKDRGLGLAILLARSNMGASIRRVSISVAALAVSLAMMVAIAVMIGSFRSTVVYWVGQTLEADLFVAGGRAGPLADRSVVSAEVEQIIAAHPATVAIDGFRSIDVPYGDSLVIVGSGRFPVMLEHGNLLFKAPEDGSEAMTSAIGNDAVVVSESFALRYGMGVGDQVVLPTRDGPSDFRIAGVYFDYSSDRGLIVMDEPVFDAHYDARRPSGLTVYLDGGSEPGQVRSEILASVGSQQPVFVTTNALLRAQVLEIFDSTFAITYALEGIAILVSMLGVATTLLTLVLERRRDIAMLRLVGAERRHLRQVIMAEAGMLGLVSLGIGLGVGLVLSVILIFVINVQSFGWTIQFDLPTTFLVQAGVVILVATVVAGLYPARLAGRMTLADLAAEEAE